MKTFYQLLLNSLVATVSNFAVWFGLIYFVYLETKSVMATSIISGIFLVSTATTGFWIGSLVDRFNKRKIMIASGIFSLIIFVISFAIYQSKSDTFNRIDNPLLWIFIVVTMFGVMAGNVRNIALPVLIPSLVGKDKIDKANGLAGTASGVSFLVVNVISGILVGLAGMYYVFILAIVVSIVTILHLALINVKEPEVNPNLTENELEQNKKVDVKGTLKIISKVPGLFALILFTTFNNFLGGVFMSLMDAYGLSLVSVETWGILWGFISLSFIIGGAIIAKKGLGKNPVKTLLHANMVIWVVSIFFTIQPSILLVVVGAFIYLAVIPFIEAAEHTIVQKVVPQERLGRVFGFAQSIEQAASPLTAFAIGPITQFLFIPFMSEGGDGARLIGSWFGTGANRGIALVFVLAGIIGLTATIFAKRSKYYHLLSNSYLKKNQVSSSLN